MQMPLEQDVGLSREVCGPHLRDENHVFRGSNLADKTRGTEQLASASVNTIYFLGVHQYRRSCPATGRQPEIIP
jgi:hypothetical protein